MSRKLRITFRNGDVRMGELPPGQTLVQLWSAFKRDGAIIGEAWCAQFDYVAMIEVVETAAADEARPEAPPGPTFGPVDRLAVVTGFGSFKPPGEA